MKKSKQSRNRQQVKRAPARMGTSGGRPRKSWFVSLGVVFGATAVVFVIALLQWIARSSQPLIDSEVPTAESTVNDLALRDESFEVALQLIADFPESSFPLVLMGTLHKHYGNSIEAEVWWLKYLEREPTSDDVYDALAALYLKKAEYQKVVDLSRKANTVDPNMPAMHRHKAEALLEMGRLDEALVAAKSEKKLTPDVGETHFVLGKIYLLREEYQQAVEAYSSALERRPNDWRCYYGLATASARLGRSDKADEYTTKFNELRANLDEVIERRMETVETRRRAGPILAETLVDAGRAYNERRQFQKAEAYWRRAASVDPEDTSCRLLLVRLYRQNGRRQKAVDVCKQLIKIDPENASYRLMIGNAFAEQGRLDLAEQAMRESIELAPERAEGYQSLANLFLRRNERLPEAKALAQKAVKLAPTARHYSLLSVTCSRSNDLPGALAAMKRAADMAPDNEEFRSAYERLQRGR